MEIVKTKEENKLVFKLSGRLDTTTAPSLEAEVTEALKTEKDIVFDLEQIEYVSSAGLRVILFTQKSVSELKGSLVIKHVTPSVLEVFDMTGFSAFLKIED